MFVRLRFSAAAAATRSAFTFGETLKLIGTVFSAVMVNLYCEVHYNTLQMRGLMCGWDVTYCAAAIRAQQRVGSD